MATLGPFKLGAIALLVTVLLTVNPVNSQEKCRSGCHGIKPHTFKYVDGTTYKYNLDGNIDVLLSTVEGQTSTTKIKATVLLTQQADCNQILRLQNVQVIGADGKKHANIPNIEKPVRINFHDGHVEDLICAEPDDTQVSLNIKRAVASLFQANIKKQYETDVFGVCPTDVNTRKEGGLFVIQKSKDLNKCSHRETAKQDFFATSFNLHSDIKTSPILNSEYFSEQKLKNGILDQATITEQYLYVPFSAGKSGAKAIVTTKLHFAGTSKDGAQEKCNVPKSILFENPHSVISEKSNVNIILAAVKDTVKTVGDTISANTADKFLNLVRIMRASKRDDLLSVYNQVNAGTAGDKETAKRVFLDALFRSGTGDTIEVTIQLLKNKPLSPVEQKLVYLGLSFARHVTPGSLKAATTLLDQQLPREAYLGIGALAGRYCKTHSCENEEALNTLTQKLLAKLGAGKANNRAKEDEIISILKAFGNMNHLSTNVLPKITAIAQDKKSSNRLRVAALEALQSDSCQDKVRDSTINILKDIQQDSEIRIKAYLAAVQCPNGKVAGAIKNLLQNEPSYQVGGFIVSHLRNLRASANPDKEFAKQQLGLINTNKNYPFDFRKYSYNQEFSYAVESLGLGTSTESNVIYSQNSFLPRSTSWNMTAEVFGHTVNFLEIDTRQENFDKLLEHYFGPLGVFNKLQPDELGEKAAEKMRQLYQKFDQHLGKILRSKRDISKAEIDTVGKQVQIKSNELNNDLDLDLSVKLFGSELLFFSLNDDIRKFTPEVLMQKLFDHIENGIEKLKSFDHTYRTNGIFLDTELSYPTSTGFPLKISAEGVSSLQLQTKGTIDIPALFNGRDHILKLNLIPSANIQVNGRLTVDAYFLESGLKTTTNLYSATGSGLECIFFNHGNGLETKLSFPLKKHELVSATHDVLLHNRELGVQETNVPLKFAGTKPFSVCVDHLSKIIGLNFCLDILRPNVANPAGQHVSLPFPLDGNSKFTVTVENEDLSNIHSKLVVHRSGKSGVEFVLEALNNKNEQKAGVTVEIYDYPQMYAKLALTSPFRNAELEGRITNTNTEQSLAINAKDMDNKYYGKIGVAISGGGNKLIYKPIFDYQLPNVQPGLVRIDGQIIVEKDGDNVKYTFQDVKLTTHNQKTYTIDGTVGREGRQTRFVNLKISDGKNNAAINSRLAFGDYDVKVNADFKNSINPQANFNFKYELSVPKDGFDSSLQIIHGADLNSKVNVFKLANSRHSYYKNKGDFKFETKHHLSYPLLHMNAKFDFLSNPNKIDYEALIAYGKHKYSSELDVELNKKTHGDYAVKFGIEGFKNKIDLKMDRVVSGEASKVHNSLEHNGKKYELNGEIKHHSKAKDINVGADLVLKIAGKPQPFKLKHSFIYNPNELDTLLKVTVGDKPIIDIFLKNLKGGNANGNVKIDLKDLLKADGQLKATKGKGNANLVVEFVKAGNKIKTETQFTIAAPTYNIDLTFYPQFEKDNNKKIALSTHNKITEHSVDSKNNLNFFDQKLDVSLKAVKDGDTFNGKQNAEIEITLPNDLYLAGKMDRQFRTVDDAVTGVGFLQLEKRDNKNTPGVKLTFKTDVKNTNCKEHIYDLVHHFTFENGNGKNFVLDTTARRNKEGDKHNVYAQVKMTGNVLQHPVEFETQGTYQGKAGDYKITGKAGQKATLDVQHKYNYNGEQTPYEDDFSMEIHTPSTKFSVLKLKSKGYLALGKDTNVDFKGSASIFVDDDGSAPDATIDIKGEFDAKIKEHQGQLKGTVNFQKLDPVTAAVGYSHHEDKDSTKCKGDVSLEYAKGKIIKLDSTLTRPNKNEVILDLNVETPHEKAKTVKFHVQTKASEDKKHVATNGKVIVNDKEYTFNTDVVTSKITPSLSSVVKYPDGKTHKFIAKVTKSSPKEFGGELQILCPHTNFDFNGKIDSKFESVDDFFVKVNANSAALKWDKIVAEANSKGSKGDKKVQFTVTSAGKNVLSGSTNYKTSEEGGKFILEGSGNVKVKDQAQSANFKFTRQHLVTDKNGEDGIELSFDASLGSKAIDAEFKVSNKHVRVLNSYCEEKKQCAHFEVDSKFNKLAEHEYNHILEINIDLRKLGLSHEFGLKSVTDVKNNLLDHTVDVHFQNQDNSKYQYSVYVHPTASGVSLTTPKRVIALEAKLDIAEKTHVKGHVYAYLDKKNQPNKKLAYLFDMKSDDGKNPIVQEFSLNSKLSAPGLPKDLSVDYKFNRDFNKDFGNFLLVIDVFANPNQKLVIDCKTKYTKDEKNGYGYNAMMTAKSAGLGIDYTEIEEFFLKPAEKLLGLKNTVEFTSGGKKYLSGGVFYASPQEAKGSFKVLNRDLVSFESKYHLSKESQIFDTSISSYGLSPLVIHAEFANYNTFHETVYCKDYPNNKLNIHAAFIIGQIADYRVEFDKGGKKHNLIHSSIKLDETNFLKSDFGVDYNNIKNHLIVPMKEGVSNIVVKEQELLDQITKDAKQISRNLGEKMKNSVPKITNTKDYYRNELNKIKEEFLADKTIQKIAEFLKNIFGAVAQTFGDIYYKLHEFFEKIAQVIHGNCSKILETIQNEVIPMFKARMEQLITATGQIFEKVTDIVFLVLGKISHFLEQHQDQLKHISTIITQTSHEIGQTIVKIVEGIRQSVTAYIHALIEEIKALPIYEELKNKYQEYFQHFQLNEVVTNTFKEFEVTIKRLLPQQEWEKIFDSFTDYKVRPTSLDYLFKLPKHIAIKMSPISYIINGEFPSIREFLHTVTFNPKLWIPPFQIQGIVAQGQHIFTFDGKHLTFPGKCNYLLVRDALNGNFSVFGTYTNGLLTAITVSDKENVATIKKDGKLLFNNVAHEYPARKGLIDVFRRYDSINIVSKAGLRVTCLNDLEGCVFLISGFYHGQLRGLLGNGNNEAYDDFTLPNGKIVTSESDFGNAYKASPNCPAVKTVDHSHHTHTPQCNKYFDQESILRLCYPFVNPDNFRTACDHGIAAGVPKTESAAVSSYVAACHLRGIHVPLPDEFVKCSNSETERKLGDTFSVKTPNKIVDVIIAIDQIKPNEAIYKDLVQPLVQQLTTEFNTKGISDVNYHVIGYGGDYEEYPSHYTVGSKLVTKDKLPQLKFTDKKKDDDFVTGFHYFDKLFNEALAVAEDLDVAFGLDPQSQAYTEAMKYPFRAEASKVVIAVTGEPCKHGYFLMLQYLRALLSVDKTINLNVITPFEYLKKDDKPAKNIIGFNQNGVFTLEKGKKDSNMELLKELKYTDYCVDFTINVRGNVFVSSNFLSAKANNRKLFVQTTSHNIVEQVTDRELDLDCECKRISTIKGKNVCKIVNIKDKHKKSK